MKLFDPIQLGSIELKNRIVMAPMTRSRAHKDGIVTQSTEIYYSQRATAGLIITEGVNITPQAVGSPFTPGIYLSEQITAWGKVAKAVHDKGGKLFMQLWHTGRVSHSSLQNGELPVAPSAIKIEGQHYTATGLQDFETPRALTTNEVKEVILDYGKAAQNAMDAGFDGVELHGAFGYLPNQFLVDASNKRDDEYGGSIPNRCKFVLEVMQELIYRCGVDKVGIKLSPSVPLQGMTDSNPLELYTYLISRLNELPIAYMQLMNALVPIDHLPHWPKDVIGTYRKLTDKTIIANGGFDRDKAEQIINDGNVQLVSFGSLFISNPDLVKRFELNSEFNTPDRATFFGGDDRGYIDYPTLLTNN